MISAWIAIPIGLVMLTLTWASIVFTLVVPRGLTGPGRLTLWITRPTRQIFIGLARFARTYEGKDKVLALTGPVALLALLAMWLLLLGAAFVVMLLPYTDDFGTDVAQVGAAMFTLGLARRPRATNDTIAILAAASGFIVIALQIAYLPALYSEFNRRENAVALLNARAGVPSWGPELLARTHYALGSGVSTVDTLPDLYESWESWAAEVGESHTTYLPLVRFRSPKPLSSWVTSLLAVLDSAALMLSLNPSTAPVVQARLCLRAGFSCFQDVARAMGLVIPDEPDPQAGIGITYEDFLEAIDRMRFVNFPIERDPAEAWPDFVGWRVNYEPAAFAIAYAIDAVPAKWSGPRRDLRHPQIPPVRPPFGRPPDGGEDKHTSGKPQPPPGGAVARVTGRRPHRPAQD